MTAEPQDCGLRLLMTANSTVFILIMTGFLFQWPTLLTLAMYPFLVWKVARLARAEERDSERRFGDACRHNARIVPAFLSAWRGRPAEGS